MSTALSSLLPASLAMGDYGFYVWGSFAAFGLFLLWDALIPPLRRRRLLRQLALRARRDAARSTSTTTSTTTNPIP